MGLIIIFLAGIFGTSLMILGMGLIHKMKWANADMVRALGSIYTKSNELALVPGLVIHYFFGIMFSFLYAMLISYSPSSSPASAMIIATLCGLVHGLIVGLFLVVIVAEYHPVEEFKEAGLEVAASHVLGHVVFGVSVGIVFYFGWASVYELLISMTPGKIIGDILGYSLIWLPLFGIPMLFGGYVAYITFTDKVRIEAQLQQQQADSEAKLDSAPAERKAS